MSKNSKFGVLGATGRLGSLIVRELETQDLPYAGGAGRNDDVEALFEKSDILIDVSAPQALEKHLAAATKYKKPLVIGTTGLSAKQHEAIKAASKDIPVLYAANMSVGVNLLLALAEQAAASLDENWDAEIFETHHKHKVDAPSGTALAIGNAVAKGRGISPLPPAHDRHGERKSGEIGYAVQRGGDVAGEHMLTFFGEGERLEIGHRATNRAIFARGAIRAALWLKDRPQGLYSMRDVLGF